MTQKRTRSRSVFDKPLPPVAAAEEAHVTPEADVASGDEHLPVTIYLSVDQLDHLDHDRIRIRRATRQVMERTVIIRGLVEGYRKSGIDLAALRIGTEAELAEFVLERLKGAKS